MENHAKIAMSYTTKAKILMSMHTRMMKNDKPFAVNDDLTYSLCNIERYRFIPSKDSLLIEVKCRRYSKTKKIKKCKSCKIERIKK